MWGGISWVDGHFLWVGEGIFWVGGAEWTFVIGG